jgi:hypothetical protein
MGRGEPFQPVQADLLGATDAFYPFDPVFGMNTESGTTDYALAKAKIEQQLGDAGHQGDDARITCGGPMNGAGGIGKNDWTICHMRIGTVPILSSVAKVINRRKRESSEKIQREIGGLKILRSNGFLIRCCTLR